MPDDTYCSQWVNPVYSTLEAPIPILQSISMPSPVLLTASDFANATVINQIDHKFILISIAASSGTILALVDQHAADERFRLETIINSLSSNIHRLSHAIKVSFPVKQLQLLSRRSGNLRSLGIEIELYDDSLQIAGIPGVLRNETDGERWKAILSSYVSMNAPDCPTPLMNMLCSKACRSVQAFS